MPLFCRKYSKLEKNFPQYIANDVTVLFPDSCCEPHHYILSFMGAYIQAKSPSPVQVMYKIG